MSTGVERVAGAFGKGHAAFMPYVMGGYPTLAKSRATGEAYAAAGADLIELGIPFSDPLADGPVIHAAGTQALKAGATVDGVLEVCEHLSKLVPVVVMTYANVVFARGPNEFAATLRERGAAGLIVPDLPLEESDDVRLACEQNELAFVPLVAPTTPPDRLERIGEQATGFLYAVSVVGTTGERGESDAYGDVIGRVKAHTDVPVALGFGISSPAQAVAAAAAGADGVIVASRLIRAIADGDETGVLAGEFAAALAQR
ncbi:MAG TPA: tryptophan synthase subunit alpha [Baekduia sp.]|nr:tryptophan synthase subunit alpha [Baekduia sp.]